jgi:hypothetical protein
VDGEFGGYREEQCLVLGKEIRRGIGDKTSMGILGSVPPAHASF